MDSIRRLVSSQRHLITLAVALLALLAIAYAFRGALFPFILGLVVAHLVMPAILRIEERLPARNKWVTAKRIYLVLGFFVLVLALVGTLGMYVVTALMDASRDLLGSAPELLSSALESIQDWLESIGRGLSEEWQDDLRGFAEDAGEWLKEQARRLFERSISLIPATVGFVFGLSFLPIFLFYVLKDWEKLGDGFYRSIPDGTVGHARNVVSILDNVLVRYFRAQIMLGIIVGTAAFAGLAVLGVEYAGVLAVLAGITEMVPIVGPWIGGGVAVIVALATSPDQAIWVAVLFAAIQLVENAFLVARIQAAYLRIHPAIVIALLAIGARVGGFWGILLAVPLTATVVEIYRYMRTTAAIEAAHANAQWPDESVDY
jgi:predicted PurR-regulated permease PerM